VLSEVTASASAAEKVKASVQKVKDKAQAIVDEIAHEKSIAHVKLEAARPALEEAEAALQTIKPAHIATVRKLAKPPHLIMRIMDAVLILFRKRLEPTQLDPDRPCCKPSWSEALKVGAAHIIQASPHLICFTSIGESSDFCALVYCNFSHLNSLMMSAKDENFVGFIPYIF
jgi:hypothetical protein